MKIFILLTLMAMPSVVFAKDETYAALSNITKPEVVSRQLDMEVRQLAMERKLRDLEEKLMKQNQNVEKIEPMHPMYRMRPWHIEVTKTDQQPLETPPSMQYPIYPIINSQVR